MRFVLKQKFWSLGDDFVIRDDRETDRFLVDGRVFSFGDKLSIRDMAGNEAAFISQRLLSWGPKYEIHRSGHGEVSKRWFSFTDSYGIDVADSGDPVLLLATAVVIDLVCHDEKKH